MKFGVYLQNAKDDEHGFTLTQGAVSYASTIPTTTSNPDTPGVSPYTKQECGGTKKFSCQYIDPNIGTNGVDGAGQALATLFLGTFDNASRNYLVGPRYTSTAQYFFKNSRFQVRYVFQFRAESFNVFNHGTLLLPSSAAVVGNPGFGLVSTASGRHVLQFSGKFSF